MGSCLISAPMGPRVRAHRQAAPKAVQGCWISSETLFPPVFNLRDGAPTQDASDKPLEATELLIRQLQGHLGALGRAADSDSLGQPDCFLRPFPEAQ